MGKKILSVIFAVSILTSCLSVFNVNAESENEEPILRVGIVGDAQCLPDTEPDYPRIDSNGYYTPAWFRGITAYEEALNQLKEKGVDMVLDVGDIGNEGIPEVWQDYKATFDKVFSDVSKIPETLFVMGNHDYHVNLVYDTPEGKRADFNKAFGKETSNEHKVVNGYHFIGVTCKDSRSDYSVETVEWLREELAKAAEAAPDKPIFIIGHAPVTDTVYESDEWGRISLDDVLKEYPQAVYFSGHSHAPLNDERSIYQKDYTCINTASLNYVELETGKVGGTLPDGVFDLSQGLYMEIYSDRVEFERLDFTNHTTIKDNWVLDMPLSPDTFKYTSDRANERQAPVFSEGTTIDCVPGASTCTFTFAQAQHEDFTHSYRVKIAEKETDKEVFEGLYFSDFYLGKENMKPEISLSAKGLKANTSYNVYITAIESFGNESEPITAEFTTADPTVLSVNFSAGKIEDTSRYDTSYKVVGELPLQDDGKGKLSMQFDGESYMYFDMNQEQIDSITNSFTVETIFKVDEFGNTQDVFANTMGNGISLEITSDGKIGVWARPRNINTWVMVEAPIEENKYYHVVGTYDGEYLSMYLNGEFVGRKEMTGEVWYSDPDLIKMTFGANPGENGTIRGNNFKGNLSMVKIESTPISESEAIGRYIDYIKETVPVNPDIVLDMNFEEEIQDNSMFNTKYDVVGNYKIEKDSDLNKNVLTLNGDGSAVRMFVNEYQLSAIKDTFTLETVFKVNEFGKTQDIIANTEYGGMSIEITPSGIAQVWVYSEEFGDYIVSEVPIEAGVYYYLTVVYDGENIIVYLNGEEVSREAMSGSVHFADSKKYPLCLGADPQPNDTITSPLNGSIAYVHLEKTPFTADAVNDKYDQWKNPGILGDVNGNGKIDIDDATLIQKYVVGIKEETFDETYADVNKDGKITVLDATLIQIILLKK